MIGTRENVQKSERKVLTNINHSTDSELVLNLRLRIYEMYGVSCPSVHDCLGIPPRYYRVVCGEYKSLLKSLVFDKCVINKIVLTDTHSGAADQLKVLQEEIAQRKKDAN